MDPCSEGEAEGTVMSIEGGVVGGERRLSEPQNL